MMFPLKINKLLLGWLLFLIPDLCLAQAPKPTALSLLAGQLADDASAIHIDQSGNVYITGWFLQRTNWFINKKDHSENFSVGCERLSSSESSDFSGFLLRYDSTRALTLIRTIDGMPGEISTDAGGNIYLSGGIDYGSYAEGFLDKYSSSGEFLWRKRVISEGRSIITSLDIASDGTMVFCAYTYGKQVHVFDHAIDGPANFVAKVDKYGRVLWTNTISSSLGIGPSVARFDHYGDIVVAGNERNSATREVKAMVAKLNGQNGVLIWKKIIENTESRYTASARTIAIANDGNYVFGGDLVGSAIFDKDTLSALGMTDIFLMKCDTAGNVLWVKTAGSTGRDRILDLFQGTDAIFFTGGHSDGFIFEDENLRSRGYTDVYAGAIDIRGNLQWIFTGGSNIAGHTDDLSYDEYGAAIAQDPQKRIHIVGRVVGSGSFGALEFLAGENTGENGFWMTMSEKASSYAVRYPCEDYVTSDLMVFPNPFSSDVTISGNISGDYSVELFNTLGQVLYHQIFNKSRVEINDLNFLKTGMYILEIKWDTGTRRFKILKD